MPAETRQTSRNKEAVRHYSFQSNLTSQGRWFIMVRTQRLTLADAGFELVFSLAGKRIDGISGCSDKIVGSPESSTVKLQKQSEVRENGLTR
ncbi:hypothetical protein Q8A67_022509 [Cirrhinus molitorella]|uniref:Uncharacterized protein n=1 Tax=Cirrhinus molitorella TaxID=172907 RepID=A0AA88TC69_9TELE|nr:hypothetical protein Q8A67_022509 [Cirrhinus molitorella]